jgi:hypothetical protein
VSPYFQVLALVKSFQREVHPTLIKQELQIIKCIEQYTSITDQLIKIVKLSTWWLPQTSDTHIWESQRFELMYTQQEKTWSTHHMLYTLDSRMVPNHTSPVVCIGNLSLVPTRSKQALHPEEVLINENRLARPSPWVTLFFLPHDNLGVGERGFGQVVTQLHQLTGLISPVCDQHVQHLLMGVNPLVLNRHCRGLQPWMCWLSTHHSPTFSTDGPPLST